MLLALLYQLIVVDVSSSDNNHVLSKVIGLMKVDDHVSIDLMNVVNISKNRLSHHMFSVDVIVDILHQGFHVIIVGCKELLPDSFLLIFKSVLIIGRVAEHISKNLDRLADTFFEGEHVIKGVLSRSISVQLESQILYLLLKGFSGSVLCAFEVQVLEEVSGA